jgi:hypothetical protein
LLLMKKYENPYRVAVGSVNEEQRENAREYILSCDEEGREATIPPSPPAIT